MQIVPSDFCHIGRKKRSVAFKIRSNPFFGRGSALDPAGEFTTFPKPPRRLEREHPSEYPTLLGTDPPSALAMRPPGIPARFTPLPVLIYSLERFSLQKK